MYVMDLDQDRSRSRPDAVPGLLEALRDVPVVLPFERTVGDEVQGLLADPAAVVETVLVAARRGGWAVGIGVGAVDAPAPESTRAGRGPAYLAARSAVESARRSTTGLRVVGPDDASAERAQTALQLVADLVGARSEAGHEAVAAMARHASQADAAVDLGISPQAMNRRLAVAGWTLEDPGRRLAAHLLQEAEVHRGTTEGER